MKRIAGILLIALPAASGWPLAAGAAKAPTDPAVVAREREALRKRLEELKKDIAEREEEHSDAADALRESEQTISKVNRRLVELRNAQRRANTELERQTQAIADKEQHLGQRQQHLSDLLRRQYAVGGLTPWGALLSGDDPQRLNRNLAYLGYIAEARAKTVAELQGELEELARLRAQADAKRTELEQLAAEENTQRQELVKQSEERRKVLADISSKLKNQRRQAVRLEQDEKRLSRVIDNLTRMLARQAEEARRKAEAARRAEQARRAAEQAAREAGKPPPPRTEPPPEEAVARNSLVPDPSLTGQFAKLRGRLRLPVAGDVVGRFGASRGEGGTWKGVFIRAPEGTEVRAVAAGKVVFADWLRGFGNLLIIDHGSEYLSIYGNNEAVLRHVGDDVKSGDIVANVGATGGQSESGLYFELRHRGAPFDPLKWASLR
ncbi:MAG: peptidoglycan DD-metalloendopeptidase family protein [Pigmentiphaga sp.]|uniref:murein hydrolase activator EnvC family protein n=1 Tax=Pigmentiphaga sp. TaxID=1977564 RepID=UPI0029B6A9A9|nr:peptidoglycan DD-metalloendopeptidase family protein [Pigmentiphaga sp.]MDX3907114.1 peptidoglycan DD-metalloendopeptidase family protein [Pigmentiphaga sp.]